jgi:hypothetical protein
VVEGSEEEHSIGARLRHAQCASVAHVGTGERRSQAIARGGARLLDVQRHGIHQVDLVPAFGQPDRVSPGAAADIGDNGRRRWEVPLEKRLRARELQRADTCSKPVAFEPLRIERGDLGKR